MRRWVEGFTLVEVLVSLVVLAVGLLGIAGLYVESLRAGRTSLNRMTAVTLAADMADRIRANTGGGVAYAGNGPGADNGCVNGANACSPEQLAADDWFRWLGDVGARLPGDASAEIAVANAPPLTQFTITLSWPETGQDDPATYTLVTRDWTGP
jgi:type IV pilus assembly protein PilV